jgi:hypothetical protein
MIHRSLLSIVFLLIFSSFSGIKVIAKNNNLKVLDLRCEYATNPIGLDVQFTQLSWQIESDKGDKRNNENNENNEDVFSLTI